MKDIIKKINKLQSKEKLEKILNESTEKQLHLLKKIIHLY